MEQSDMDSATGNPPKSMEQCDPPTAPLLVDDQLGDEKCYPSYIGDSNNPIGEFPTNQPGFIGMIEGF